MARVALAHSHPNTLGGGERALLALAAGLSARHSVRLLVGRYRPDTTFAELAAFPRQVLQTTSWLTATPPDDVIVANSFGANLLALRNGPRTLYWAHSLRSAYLRPGARHPALLARRALDLLAVRRAARLVANSRFAAERMGRLYRRPADTVVYPGVDLALFRPGGERDGGYAVTVGRLSSEKGLDRLFASWSTLADVPLHVVGSGTTEEVQRLRRLAPPGVVFRGPLAPHALAAVYQAARLAVFAPYAEEFGIAPLEALACGTPVIAWREGGAVETMVDGETGFLVRTPDELRERVRRLVADDTLRRRQAASARAWAEQFGWERSVLHIERLCLELVAGATSGPPAPAPPAWSDLPAPR